MTKGLTLKVYDVDYSFIIKNYLDEKLWEKEWTIFIYKKYHITLKLYSIDVQKRHIWFEVEIQDMNEENKSYWLKSEKTIFKYALSTDNINILKNTLNSEIFQLIQKLENEAYIQETDEWTNLQEMKDREQDELEQIAIDFLDSENVTNEEIRQAYIDYYIDNNEKVWELMHRYQNDMKYRILTDFYLIFLQAINDKDRIEIIEDKLTKEELEETLSKIKEYEEYIDTEEFKEEMEQNLEEV